MFNSIIFNIKLSYKMEKHFFFTVRKVFTFIILLYVLVKLNAL